MVCNWPWFGRTGTGLHCSSELAPSVLHFIVHSFLVVVSFLFVCFLPMCIKKDANMHALHSSWHIGFLIKPILCAERCFVMYNTLKMSLGMFIIISSVSCW